MSGHTLAPGICAAVVAAGVALVSAAYPAARQGPARDALVVNLPPGEGQTMVAKQCAGCHGLEGVVKFRAATAQWEALVLDMGARGAPIMLEDVDPLVKYLSTVFGPDAPPFTDANTATKAELIRLPSVTPEAADRLIAARSAGPLTSAEQVRTALGLDDPTFDRIRYYVYVKPAAPAR